MSTLETLKLFSTAEHPCSYLDDKEATTLFIDPDADLDSAMYSQLSDYGFRRSGSHVYKPSCQTCQACTPVRVPVETFMPSKSQQRCIKRNSDLNVNAVNAIDTDEHFQLYEKYINARHQDGDMFPAKKDEYLSFLSPQFGITQYLEFRDPQNTLVALAVTDKLHQGLSAIYTFFDPDQEKRSLGVYAILAQIEWAKENKQSYLYLGYWIKQCRKMNYKTQYSPFQLLINNQWLTFG